MNEAETKKRIDRLLGLLRQAEEIIKWAALQNTDVSRAMHATIVLGKIAKERDQ